LNCMRLYHFCVEKILHVLSSPIVGLENVPLQLLAQVVSTPAVSLHCKINEVHLEAIL
jgi:hypothetical protein